MVLNGRVGGRSYCSQRWMQVHWWIWVQQRVQVQWRVWVQVGRDVGQNAVVVGDRKKEGRKFSKSLLYLEFQAQIELSGRLCAWCSDYLNQWKHNTGG